jgi:glycosyltransferase involved in cell wall biosynthesis
MSSIRVCAITCDCYPQDTLVRRISEAATGPGFEYHVICSMSEGEKKYEVFNGVHVHRIFIRGPKGKPLGRITGMPLGRTLLLWFIFMFRALWKVARLHLKQKFDIIHAHNMPDFLVFAALVPKIFGARVILHVQDVSPELMAVKAKGHSRNIVVLLAKWQEHISTAFADYILTVGWPFEQCLLKRGVPQKKLSSVLNSADPRIFPLEKRTEPFLGEPTAEHPLILMYHGTLSERAGLDIAIRAFVKAREAAPHLRLHFMGSGEALPSMKQLAQELGVTDYIDFMPSRLPDEVADFITQRDIGIIPYLSNGFMDLLLPTKAYEFVLMRRPMIVSNLFAMRSMFRPESVILCKPSNIANFAEAIIDLYQHPQKRVQLSTNAEQDYVPYRWEIMAKRYQQLLISLATKNTRR